MVLLFQNANMGNTRRSSLARRGRESKSCESMDIYMDKVWADCSSEQELRQKRIAAQVVQLTIAKNLAEILEA